MKNLKSVEEYKELSNVTKNTLLEKMFKFAWFIIGFSRSEYDYQ